MILLLIMTLFSLHWGVSESYNCSAFCEKFDDCCRSWFPSPIIRDNRATNKRTENNVFVGTPDSDKIALPMTKAEILKLRYFPYMYDN